MAAMHSTIATLIRVDSSLPQRVKQRAQEKVG
jgi:hypothetical protein